MRNTVRGARGAGRGARVEPNHQASEFYRFIVVVRFGFLLSLAPCLLPLAPVSAAQWPSLFRGVVVTDSPLGVRVISVEESSQAYLADLRPEDIIIRVNGQEIHSIDEFAALSTALKARADKTEVLLFRNGTPRELVIHLYSYPILQAWGLEFIPEHDVRFAEARIGLDYWVRLGRGFEEARQPTEALSAYLNGLHNVSTDIDTAFKVADLFFQIGDQHVREHQLTDGIASLRQAVLMMEKLFAVPLTDEQLGRIKHQLQETLEILQHVSAPQKSES